jgi:hypothetical protein
MHATIVIRCVGHGDKGFKVDKKFNIGKSIGLALSAATFAICGASHAAFVTNGDFESTTNGTNQKLGTGGTTNLTGWTLSQPGPNSPIAMVYGVNGADSGANATTVGQLWGPGNGTANGLTATSPAGGNFIASDADPAFAGTFSQTLSGLTVGAQYVLSFYYAAAQYRNAAGTDWNGATFSRWAGSIGNQQFSTPTLNIVSHGFSGWQQFSVTTTATSATEVLSFLAFGGPSGLPPAALLDGVTLTAVITAVPEPAAYSLMLLGLAGLFVVGQRKKYTS